MTPSAGIFQNNKGYHGIPSKVRSSHINEEAHPWSVSCTVRDLFPGERHRESGDCSVEMLLLWLVVCKASGFIFLLI